MAVTNTGIVLRTITGVNESDLFLDSEATSVATNTGIVERSIVGVHDANFVHPLGDELATNGDFSNGSTNWILGVAAEVSNGVGNFSSNGDYIRQSSVFSANVNYKITFDVNVVSGTLYAAYDGTLDPTIISTVGSTTQTVYYSTSTGGALWFYGINFVGSIDNVSVKEMLVNRESTTTNTGIVERPITGVNESELWLDAESTSVVNNTGIVERPITGVNESDALFPDNTESTVVNISDTIIPLLTALEARATTFENREGTQNILINLEKC